MAILIIISNATGLIAGFIIGKYSERIKWNELIKKGIIPKPSKHNKR